MTILFLLLIIIRSKHQNSNGVIITVPDHTLQKLFFRTAGISDDKAMETFG
jgi:hypothetical protein